MKPGETTSPVASIVISASSSFRSPILATVSPWMPISAARSAPPVPSARRPPRMITSSMSGPRSRLRGRAEAQFPEALAPHPRSFMSERIEALRDPPDEIRGERPAHAPDGAVALVDEPDDEQVPDVPRPRGLHV